MGNAVARVGGTFRVPFYSMVNVPHSRLLFYLHWDTNIILAQGAVQIRDESSLLGSLYNWLPYDPDIGPDVETTIEAPNLLIWMCDPCNTKYDHPHNAFIDLHNYHSAFLPFPRPLEPEKDYPGLEEFHHVDILFQVRPTARAGETRIDFVEDPNSAGPDNTAFLDYNDYPARPRLSGRVTILPALETFLRADANQDGRVNLSDPVFLLAALFLGKGPIPYPDAGDADDDGRLDVTNAVYTLDHLFQGGPPPPFPYPDPGPDPTEDGLGCGP